MTQAQNLAIGGSNFNSSGILQPAGGGTGQATPIIPSGSVFLVYQSAAPTGWTQVTTAGLNDTALRIVTSAGGTTGGTTAFSTVFANQTPTFTGAIGTLASGATTLSAAQMPSHTHVQGIDTSYNPADAGQAGRYAQNDNNSSRGSSGISTDGAGSSTSHSHALSGTPGGTVSAVTLNVKYANMILCSKN
jgi:hypothetical protein